MPADPPPVASPAWHELLDHLTAIRGRAQATRHRVRRVDRLSRAHIAADLAAIEARADALAALLVRFAPEVPAGLGHGRSAPAPRPVAGARHGGPNR
jgi:hypothetical protein